MKDGIKKDDITDDEFRIIIEEIEKWRDVERLTDVIWSIDMNLKFTYISPAVEKLLGYTQDEMLTKSLYHLLTPKSLDLIKETLAESLERDATDNRLDIPPPIEVEVKHRDGTSIWLELTRVFMRDENSIPIGVLGVARNISDRINTTRALKESETKYRALAERSVLGIVIAQDNPIRLSYVNDTMEGILGYSKEEITQWEGEETAKLIHPDDRAYFFRRFRERLDDTHPGGAFVFRTVRKDGEIAWLEVHGASIEFKSEPAVLATFVDITARRLAEIEMNNARKFTEFLIDLMSHDLNNIHQGIMTALELMSMHDNIPIDSRALLEKSVSQLDRAAGLISRVKTLSDIKSKTMKRVRTDIHDPISKAIESVRDTFPQKEIIANSNVEPNTYFVFGCTFFFDVFYNLLHNSVKFDDNEPVILDINAEISTDESFLQVTISDRGSGIPDSEKSRMFSRLDDKRSEWSGIGLTLVKEIIDRCQGKIWIEDRVSGDYSKGTRFVIHFEIFQD